MENQNDEDIQDIKKNVSCNDKISETSTSNKQPKLNEYVNKKFQQSNSRHKAITQAIGAFISYDLRPFSVVDNAGFQHLLSVLEPRYKVPSRTHISETVIPGLYRNVKQRIEGEIEKADYIALTTDTWSSRATENYVAVTAHFVDQSEWTMKCYTLQTKVFPESHTADNLARSLLETIEEWKIKKDDTGPAICTDNAANIVKAVQVAQIGRHIPCFAHTLNLATQRGLTIPEVSRLLGRVRRIVAFFHRSTSAAALLKSKQTLLGLTPKKLIMDVQTRWNSSFDMSARYLEQQAAVFATLVDKNIKKNVGSIVTLSDQDNRNLEAVVKVLAPLKTATTTMCSTRNPTVSMIHPMKERLLQELKIGTADTGLVKQLKTAIINDFLPRYSSDIQDFLLQTSALDPRFKSLPYTSEDERENVFSTIQADAVRLLEVPVVVKQEKMDDAAPAAPDLPQLEMDTDPEQPAPEPDTVTEAQAHGSDLDSFFGDVFITKFQAGHSPLDRVKQELVNYRSESSPPVSSQPLEWWKERLAIYPALSKLAMRALCIPGTSVESERVFSTAGDVVSHQRASLSPDSVNMLVFLKKNLKIPGDLQ